MTTASEPTTVHGAFRPVAMRRGDAPLLVIEATTAASYGIEPGERSWAEVDGEVERLRGLYAQAGYGHGHRVGLLLENRPAFFTHWLALNALGASIVPIHADLHPSEWAWLIAHSEMCLAVAQPGREAGLREAAGKAGKHLETMRPEALGTVPKARTAPPAADRLPGRESECALLYTSGTTGRPKGCRLANAYFLDAGAWYLGLGGLAEVRPDVERFITPLPLSHMNALAFSAMAAILSGGALVQLDRFHPKTWWTSVRASGATIVHYLGVMPAMLLEAPPGPRDREHAVRFGFGAGVDPRHHAAFEERFGFPLLEAWAMTETGSAACIMANREPRHVGTRCFGRAEETVDVRVVDEQGADVGVDLPGELLVRAPGKHSRKGFFLGYLKDEAATEEAWADGWFHTGDVVKRSAEGDFHFVDRRKNVIRRSGENISAVEVESVLATHPAVAACAVAPTPDPKRGDEVLACIVARPAHGGLTPEQVAASIVRHALERLAYFKAPGYVAFVAALPLTVSQKVQRGELREFAKNLPGQPGCFDLRAMKKRKKALDAAATMPGGLLSGPGNLSTTTGALEKPGAAPRMPRWTDPPAADDAPAGDTAAAPGEPPPRDVGVTRRRASYEGVAVAVPVTVPYARYSTHGAHWFVGRALDALVERSGIAKERIDGLTVSSFSLAPDTAVGVTQHLGLSPRWLDHIPTGGASGVMALRRAARAVQAGDADIVACVAADANHVESFRQMLGGFSHFARDASYPYGSGGPNAIFAFITAAYMRAYGATREDFGRICVAQRANALRNPDALFKTPLTMAAYLDARPIAEPIHLFDCVMPCAGAEAFLVMEEARARDLGLAHVRVRGAIERHNAYADDPVLLRGGWRVDRDDLYAQAGVGPADIDFVQTYDDYPVVVMLQFEDLGFCEKGEGPAFVRSRSLTHDGDFPNNTSGGQLSAGQAGCAGGFMGVTEAVRQLTGAAGARAVTNATVGLVSGFGMVTYDRCLCTGAAILEAAA